MSLSLAGRDVRAPLPRPVGDAPANEVLIVAAEASADLHAAGFVRALRAKRPGVRVVGIGGAQLEREGVTLLERAESLAVMGFVEVIAHVPKHWALLRTLEQRMRSGTVGLVVLLDYPGFNMKVAAAAKAAGVPVLYYITPQVWAWGRGRLERLAQIVTKAACILPFEESLLREHKIDATFVGHPLLDRVGAMPSRAEARASLGLPENAEVLALFPGSRVQEISRHLDVSVDAARLLERERPGLRVVIAVAPTVEIRDGDVPYPLARVAPFTVLRAADAALCKSGTTTLEAAVAGCPLIVVYKTNAITYAMARHLVSIPHIGLVNVVAGRAVAPEFVQHAFTASAAASALAPLLDHASPARAAMIGELDRVRTMLGTPGAAERVAAIADTLLQ
jgi:lipid-A-disaccharide synthase